MTKCGSHPHVREGFNLTLQVLTMPKATFCKLVSMLVYTAMQCSAPTYFAKVDGGRFERAGGLETA